MHHHGAFSPPPIPELQVFHQQDSLGQGCNSEAEKIGQLEKHCCLPPKCGWANWGLNREPKIRIAKNPLTIAHIQKNQFSTCPSLFRCSQIPPKCNPRCPSFQTTPPPLCAVEYKQFVPIQPPSPVSNPPYFLCHPIKFSFMQRHIIARNGMGRNGVGFGRLKDLARFSFDLHHLFTCK